MDVVKELHASIAKACEASFDKAYRDLESVRAVSETAIRDAENNARIADENRQAAELKIEDLQREIVALRDELRHYEHSKSEIDLPRAFTNLEAEFAPNRIRESHQQRPDKQREELEDKYATLYANLQTLVRSWSSLKAKVLQHKKKLRHWDKQLERDEFTLLLQGAPVTFRRVQIATGKDASTAAHLTTGPPATDPCPRAEVFRSPGDAPGAKTNIRSQEDNQQMILPVQPGQPDRQTTHPEHDPVSSESYSDVLHPLPNLQTRKRKRVLDPSQCQPKENKPESSAHVKDEPISSSPVQSATHSHGQPLPSTQDLDEVGDTVRTPTKRHAQRKIPWEDPTVERGAACSYSQQSQPNRPYHGTSILQPVDGNSRIPKVPPGHSLGIKRRKQTYRRAALSMAEDGDSGECDSRYHKQRSKDTLTAHNVPSKSQSDVSATQSRLQGLLERPLPTRSTPGHVKSAHGSRGAQCSARDTSEHSSQQRLEQCSESATESGSQNCPDVRPEDEPFRSLPLHRLNLDHFKINPARNKGLDYAYDAVVRKKDDRKCLSGCTRPGCCGDRFRAMARLGGSPTRSSKEQEQEDQRILEEYVGDDRRLLDGLSAEDREDLLVEARARALANQYGKHRHDHERARTPPGFWRTDMPDTQELESDREAAQRLEREKVEERYREAMRPGGLWTWADG